MTVDLLVVNYNTKDHLVNLVEHLNSDYRPGVWKLYIQDNGSTDGSIEWLEDESHGFHIEHIKFSDNVGYSAAINGLSSISDSDILAAVNADTQFTTRHVAQMQQSFDDNPNQAICGPKQIDHHHRIKHGGITWEGLGTNPIHRGWNDLDPRDQMFKDRVQCWTVSGSLYYVRRAVWEELTYCQPYRDAINDQSPQGAFLPTPHYFEETFCSVHAQKHGYEVWYDGVVETAYHAWHASSEIGSDAEAKFWPISKAMYIETCNKLEITHEC